MNWVGGSRARFRARQQKEPTKGPLQRTQQSTTATNESAEGENLVTDDDETPIVPPRYPQTRPPRRSGRKEVHVEPPKEIDLGALGYTKVGEGGPRRVVPMLELIEKKLPNGHVLSLQLSHQVDLTRMREPDSSSSIASTPSSTTVGSVTITTTHTTQTY